MSSIATAKDVKDININEKIRSREVRLIDENGGQLGVVSTYEALKNPTLNKDPHFKTFLDIFANPKSGFKQLTTQGDTDQLLWTAFIGKWEAGQVPDLQAGLQALAEDIDKQAQLG